MVSEAEPPLTKHWTQHLGKVVSGSIVTSGLVEHHLPGSALSDVSWCWTPAPGLLRCGIALIHTSQTVHLDHIGRPHLNLDTFVAMITIDSDILEHVLMTSETMS